MLRLLPRAELTPDYSTALLEKRSRRMDQARVIVRPDKPLEPFLEEACFALLGAESPEAYRNRASRYTAEELRKIEEIGASYIPLHEHVLNTLKRCQVGSGPPITFR